MTVLKAFRLQVREDFISWFFVCHKKQVRVGSGKAHDRLILYVPGYNMGNISLEILPPSPCQRPKSS